MAIGSITRGTTGTNRLRRIDRWIAASPVLRRADDPLVVDLGYGASATTTIELAGRLRRTRPDVEVIGIEIDPARVALASTQLEAARAGGTTHPLVSFVRGGFEVPTARRPAVIRAMNVLRQYEESEVQPHWRRMVARLAPGGMLVEGTCNELGRVASWAEVTVEGAQSLTVSLRLTDLELPSIVAERLPKALIHRNVEGEPVHRFLAELDRHWRAAAPLSTFGPSQRWVRAIEGLVDDGWPVLGGRTRRRLGEVTVAWSAVAPNGVRWG